MKFHAGSGMRGLLVAKALKAAVLLAAGFFLLSRAVAGPSAQAQAVAKPGQVRAVREIDDPVTGARWMLLRDGGFPAGPGRLVRVAALQTGQWTGQAGGNSAFHDVEIMAPLHPVIHGGDKLIVEENTAFAQAWLEATALGPAPVGAHFQARLKSDGSEVRVLALGAGRAELAPTIGAWR